MKLSEKMLAALNDQLKHEFESHYLYLAMAARLNQLRMLGAAHWMRIQAAEELGHAMKMLDFIESRDGIISLKAIDAPQQDWSDGLAIFKAALAHEQKMTERFNTLVNLALEDRDHGTNNLLQWFVAEQVEEESSLNDIIAQLELVGGQGTGLFLIDRDLGQRTATPAP